MTRDELERAIYEACPVDTPFLDRLKLTRWQRLKRFAWRYTIFRVSFKLFGVRNDWQTPPKSNEWQKEL